MSICEICNNQTEALRAKIATDLEGHGISFDHFRRMSPEERFSSFKTGFGLNGSMEINQVQKVDHELGLIIIKPELVSHASDIEYYLRDFAGVKIVEIKDFVYSREQFWQIYGENFSKYFSEFPHGPLLTLIATNTASRLVVFRRPTAYDCVDRYNKITEELTIEKIDMDDPQKVFDHLFIKGGDYSLRKKVCNRILETKGVDFMNNDSCPGVCWDFTGTFSRRSVEENLRTFNGVHSPGSLQELNRNLQVLNIYK